MSLLSSDTDSIGLGKLQFTSKAVQEERLIGDAHLTTSKGLSITDLPDDCLSLVYKNLKSDIEHSSFGLVCRHWLHIQNDNHESLWDIYNSKCSLRKSSKISPESFSIILSSLLIRFHHLKRLSLSGLPEVTDNITPQSQFFGSEVQFLCLRYFSGYSDKKLSLIFSAFPRLTSVRLSSSNITDTGLEVLAKCCASLQKVKLTYCEQITDKGLKILAKSCASLKKVDLSDCQGITDSGISFIIQNCSKIRSLKISYCSNVTGIGFLGCPKTMIEVDATDMCKLTTVGIKAIASGGGIKYLDLSGNAVNNEAVITISKCFPLLKSL
ncbi:F-box/LRR-repeat protein 12-like [Papaver somniferum]|uniref:F-box/LRR-repeat protein 12-like n=1 Tax=Papaver somniferum TaxID=3469 RepID=UPI000E6F8E84|nr:F-box/LRR-repeat protein 12-like [Papaver somniferum]